MSVVTDPLSARPALGAPGSLVYTVMTLVVWPVIRIVSSTTFTRPSPPGGISDADAVRIRRTAEARVLTAFAARARAEARIGRRRRIALLAVVGPTVAARVAEIHRVVDRVRPEPVARVGGAEHRRLHDQRQRCE